MLSAGEASQQPINTLGCMQQLQINMLIFNLSVHANAMQLQHIQLQHSQSTISQQWYGHT